MAGWRALNWLEIKREVTRKMASQADKEMKCARYPVRAAIMKSAIIGMQFTEPLSLDKFVALQCNYFLASASNVDRVPWRSRCIFLRDGV